MMKPLPPPQLVFVPGSSNSVRVVAECVVLQDEQDTSGCAWWRWSYKAGMGGTSLQGVEADVSASCIYKRECRTEGGRGRRRIQGGSSVRVLPLPFLPLHRSPGPARATDIITRFGYHNDCHSIPTPSASHQQPLHNLNTPPPSRQLSPLLLEYYQYP